jgi:hypothetical protein
MRNKASSSILKGSLSANGVFLQKYAWSADSMGYPRCFVYFRCVVDFLGAIRGLMLAIFRLIFVLIAFPLSLVAGFKSHATPNQRMLFNACYL